MNTPSKTLPICKYRVKYQVQSFSQIEGIFEVIDFEF